MSERVCGCVPPLLLARIQRGSLAATPARCPRARDPHLSALELPRC